VLNLPLINKTPVNKLYIGLRAEIPISWLLQTHNISGGQSL